MFFILQKYEQFNGCGWGGNEEEKEKRGKLEKKGGKGGKRGNVFFPLVCFTQENKQNLFLKNMILFSLKGIVKHKG